ncbi:MAG: fibronectin type III domain-containing protein, partial [Methanomassiliicoccales archaeon]
SGQDLFSKIQWNAPTSDIFYVKIVEWGGNGGPDYTYDVNVIETAPPSAPRNLAVNVGDSYVNLTWEAPTSDGGASITSYWIYRGTEQGQETLHDTVGNILYYDDITDVTNGVTYYYYVKARNIAGESPASNEESAIPGTVPDAPTNLATSPGDKYINLSWTAPTYNGGLNITNYRIYRSKSPGKKDFYKETGNVTFFNDTGLTNGDTYYYNVSAVNAIGEGPLSGETNATPIAVPGAPRSLEVTVGDSFVNITWTNPTSNGGTPITKFKIYRSEQSGEEEFLAETEYTSFYNDTEVTNGMKYFYVVSAVNKVGEGPQSDEIEAIPVTIPTTPRNVAVSSSGDSYVHLTWTEPASNGGSSISNYRIYRSTATGEEKFLTEIGNVTEYNDTTVTIGVTYYYNVSAKNDVGEGVISNEISVKPITVPAEPKYLIASAEDDYINISWEPPTSNGGSPITNYKIYRGPSLGELTLLVEVGNVTYYNDKSVDEGDTYYYKVSAVNDAGEGEQSDEVSASAETGAEELPLLLIIILIVVVLAIVGAVVGIRARAKKKKAQPPAEELPTFEMEFVPEEPVPIFQPEPTIAPAPQFQISTLSEVTFKCPHCLRLFTTKNPMRPIVVNCPVCNGQSMVLPQ